MLSLDMKTIVFSYLANSTVCLLVLFLLWRQSRKRFDGIGFWVLDYLFQTAGLALIVLRGSIHEWLSVVVANTLIVGGALLGYIGLERFVGKRSSQVRNILVLGAFVTIHAYFAFVQPNLAARNLNLSLGLLILCGQCAWLLLYGVEPGMRSLTRLVGVVFGLYSLLSVVRIVESLVGPNPGTDFFRSGAFDRSVLLSYQVLFLLLTYSLVLMVNKRLLGDIKIQEEKFAKAFRHSPNAITLTRLFDGTIMEVNEGFSKITGYEYGEAIGKTTVDLHLWNSERDRLSAVEELAKTGRIQDRELQLRKKSGEIVTGLLSAEVFRMNHREFILSSLTDISDRKRAEAEREEHIRELR